LSLQQKIYLVAAKMIALCECSLPLSQAVVSLLPKEGLREIDDFYRPEAAVRRYFRRLSDLEENSRSFSSQA
jgi:hypothetical protein